MSKHLYILRHGKSDWHTDYGRDFERPLNKRGRQQTHDIGQWMKAQGIIPETILSSPAERAKQTVENICTELDIDHAIIQWQPDFYLTSPHALFKEITEQFSHTNSLLIVGHNPGMEQLLDGLVSEHISLSRKGKLMPTATLAHVILDNNGSGTLVTITRPEDLA